MVRKVKKKVKKRKKRVIIGNTLPLSRPLIPPIPSFRCGLRRLTTLDWGLLQNYTRFLLFLIRGGKSRHFSGTQRLFSLTHLYWGFTILGLGRLWLLHCFTVPEEFDSSVSLSSPGAWVAYDKFDHFNGFKDSTKLATNFSR